MPEENNVTRRLSRQGRAGAKNSTVPVELKPHSSLTGTQRSLPGNGHCHSVSPTIESAQFEPTSENNKKIYRHAFASLFSFPRVHMHSTVLLGQNLPVAVRPKKSIQVNRNVSEASSIKPSAESRGDRSDCNDRAFSFNISDGVDIRFERGEKWKAVVSERRGLLFKSRSFPIVCERNADVGSVLAELKQQSKARQRQRIHLHSNTGVVYLGRQGLQGGKRNDLSHQRSSSIGEQSVNDALSEVSGKLTDSKKLASVYEFIEGLECDSLRSSDISPLMDLMESPISLEHAMTDRSLAEQFDIITSKISTQNLESSSDGGNASLASSPKTRHGQTYDKKNSGNGRCLVLTEQTRLVEYVESSCINSISELVVAINNAEEPIESRLLLEWADEYIQTFTEMNVGQMTTAELSEYFMFGEVFPSSEQRQKCLLDWIRSIADKLIEEEGHEVLIERIEIMLHRIDAEVFTKWPDLLVTLCTRLLDQLDVRDGPLSRQAFLYQSKILYAIRRGLLLLQRVAPEQWSPNGGRSLLEIFKNRLKSIQQSCSSYPMIFLAEMMGENINQFTLTGCHLRHKNTQKRMSRSGDELSGFNEVLRSLETLGLDVEKLDEGCKRWQDAFRVNANANLRPWYIQYQNLNKDALLTLYDSKNFANFLQNLQLVKKRRLVPTNDARRKALEFGTINIVGMLVLYSKIDAVRLKCLRELISLRDEWHLDRDIVCQILETLLIIAAQGDDVERSMARSALTEWAHLKAPSKMLRFLQCVRGSTKRSNTMSRKQTLRLRSTMTEWLGKRSVDAVISAYLSDCKANADRGNTFFQSVGSATISSASVQSCHERIDRNRIRVSLSAPPLVPFFKGREQEREAILGALQSKADLVYVPPLVGASGSGKTQLVCKAMETQRRFTKYRHEFWIPSSSRQSIVDAFIKMARLLEISPDESLEITIECVKSRLKRDLCLYVFDDAPSLSAIQEFFPVEKGHVIVTSKQADAQQWFPATQPIMLQPLNGRDIVDLACSLGFHGDENDKKNLENVISRVSMSPLVMVQLFSTLRNSHQHLSDEVVSAWIQAVEYFSQDRHQGQGDDHESEYNALLVVRNALDALRQISSPEGSVAVHLLSQLSIIDSSSIPLDWMLLWDSKDISLRKQSTKRALSLLHDYALVLLDKDQKKVHVHAKTQAAIRRLNLRPDSEALIRSLIAFVGDTDSVQRRHGARMTTMAHARSMLERLQTAPTAEYEIELLAKHLSSTCNTVCLTDESLYWARMRIDFARKRHGMDDHDEIIAAQTGLSSILDACGRSEEAWELWSEAKTMVLRLHKDTEDTSTAHLLTSYGRHAVELGKTKEGLAAYEEAYDFLKRSTLIEADSNLRIQLLSDIADCCSKLELVDRTMKIREEVMKSVQEKYPDQNHPARPQCISNLAVAMARAGMKAEAFRNLRTALDITERIYEGKAHPDLCHLLHNLGCISTDLGKRHDAATYSKRAVDMLRRLHGRHDHMDSVKALHARGLSLCQYGRNGEGLKCAEEALKMCQRLAKGKELPELSRYHRTVALMHLEQDDDRAVDSYSEKASVLSLRLHRERHQLKLKSHRQLYPYARSSISSSILPIKTEFRSYDSDNSDQLGSGSSVG